MGISVDMCVELVAAAPSVCTFLGSFLLSSCIWVDEGVVLVTSDPGSHASLFFLCRVLLMSQVSASSFPGSKRAVSSLSTPWTTCGFMGRDGLKPWKGMFLGPLFSLPEPI